MEIRESESSIFDDVVEHTVTQLKDKLGNRLRGILLIGSAASKKIITNWSDIDLLIIIDNLSKDIVEIINSIISTKEIKIGCTIYAEKEILNGIMDAKSYYYLFLVQEKVLDFKYIDNRLKIPIITKQKLDIKMKDILFNNLHICKRNLFYLDWNFGVCKSQFKIIYASMKCILVINDYYALNYSETFTNFSELYNFKKFDYLNFISDMVNDNINIQYLKEYSLNFLNFISENSNILKINEVV